MTPSIKHARSNDTVGDPAEREGGSAEASSSAPREDAKEKNGRSSSNTTTTAADSNRMTATSTATSNTTTATSTNTDIGPPAARRRKRNMSAEQYIPAYLQRAGVVHYHGDFMCCLNFHTSIVAHLMAEGFLPIATVVRRQQPRASGYASLLGGRRSEAQQQYQYLLLPKLHRERCVIRLDTDLHISKSVRKKANKFYFTINQEFDRVVEGCHQQHGRECWLYPPLVEAFQEIHQQTKQQGGYKTPMVRLNTNSEKDGTKNANDGDDLVVSVGLYSLEVWNAATNELVAGELGYTVGSIYTSLTGFSRQDSAGSVQLAALGRLLLACQFTLWDLGMSMEYKKALGSHLMPRDEYVDIVHQVRGNSKSLPQWTSPETANCRQVIDHKLPMDDCSTIPPRSAAKAKQEEVDV